MLSAEHITAGYGHWPVLHDVTISVGEGEFVAILGANGAGKSTLFTTISGLIRPTAGAIRFKGVDITNTPPHRRPHLGIACVPEGRQLFPSLTVMENLQAGAMTPRGRANWHENLERIFAWLPVLAERQNQLAGTLSGGEQQMVAIGRGLAAAPALLMLDEPSMGLSPALADAVFERLLEIRRQSGQTILLVEQRVSEAIEHADRAYVMETGRVVLEGRSSDLRVDDRIRQAYLGM